MKSKSIIVLITALVLYSFQNTVAQITTEKRDSAVSLDSAKIIYTCSMHPEIVSDKPGNCPKCGMKLIVKDENQQMGMMMCPMHGMVDMGHKHDEARKDNIKKMKWMGMGVAMVAMMIVMFVLVRH